MPGEVADDTSFTRRCIDAPDLRVGANREDRVAGGAPQRRTFALAQIEAGHTARGHPLRDLVREGDDVQLAFPHLSARDVGDATAVGRPVHVDAICGPHPLDQHAPLA